MKINVFNYYWGVSICFSMKKLEFSVYIDRSSDNIEIYVGNSFQHEYTHSKILWSVPWGEFAIKHYFYLINGIPRIKTMKINTVKKYFKNIIIRINKLGAFY